MSFSDPVQAAAAAEFAADGGATTAVTFSSPDDSYFTNTTAAFTEAFGEAGGEVVRDFTFGIADEDFSSQVNELASLDPQPEVLYTAMIMPGAGVLLEQLEAADLGDIQVIGADSFDATVVWSAGDVANDVSFTAHTFPATTTACRSSSTPPRRQTWRSRRSASVRWHPTSSRCSPTPPRRPARPTAPR